MVTVGKICSSSKYYVIMSNSMYKYNSKFHASFQKKHCNLKKGSLSLILALFNNIWFNKEIRCHVKSYSIQCLQIAKLDIKQQVKWTLNLVIVDGHFNNLCLCGYGFVNILV